MKYLITTIIPIYNVEDYLKETIDSVVNQTIGFENIQLILVNDGSPDNSEEICLTYKEKYPENIVYIKQENAGVSAARNAGIPYIEGKYVNFLDSDDKWDLDAYKNVYEFFEEHQEEVDVVGCRMKFFEASNDYHMLDYKFNNGSQVVDLEEKYNFVHLHVTSTVFSRCIVKRHRFDPNLKYGEDAKYVLESTLESNKIGLCKEAIHYYRRRYAGTSAIQTKKTDIKYYFETFDYYYKELIDKSNKLYGKILRYIQFIMMYDFQWRITEKIPYGVLSDEAKKNYQSLLKEYLGYIDDDIIVSMDKLYADNKFFSLCTKYDRNIEEDCEVYRKPYVKKLSGWLYLKDIPIYKVSKKSLIRFTRVEMNDDFLHLEGVTSCILDRKNYFYYIKDSNNKKYRLDTFELLAHEKYDNLGNKWYKYGFIIDIPIKTELEKLSLYICYRDSCDFKIMFNCQEYTGYNQRYENSYRISGKYILFHQEKTMRIQKYNHWLHYKLENKYVNEIIERFEKDTKDFSGKLSLEDILAFRKKYWIKKILKRKEIWLVSDRKNLANDNGMCFFNYIQKSHKSEVNTYFVIEESSLDYKKMKKTGKVLAYGSKEHLMMSLLCDNVISSQANDNDVFFFDEYKIFVKDLVNYRFVFLQHGIISGDMSFWLNRFKKNISIFVTGGKPEYNSIVFGDYCYGGDEVKLTGLPRHDELIHKSHIIEKEKYIIIIPTWRHKYKGCGDPKIGKSIYNPRFKDTLFFMFYNRLINDERLINVLKKNGYRAKFCLHPMFLMQSSHFRGNEYVEINEGEVDYQNEFAKASLLITDYSSVFFDFSYLKRPIIYTQFDKEDFYFNDIVAKEGYFDFEKDGFGPVCYNYESTINTIVSAIEYGCPMEEKYLERIENFYAYFDDNNCERVYEAITKK